MVDLEAHQEWGLEDRWAWDLWDRLVEEAQWDPGHRLCKEVMEDLVMVLVLQVHLVNVFRALHQEEWAQSWEGQEAHLQIWCKATMIILDRWDLIFHKIRMVGAVEILEWMVDGIW